MRLLWIILPILLQGAHGQFITQPEPLSVVHQGEAVTLECILEKPGGTCAWKLNITGFAITGFISVPDNIDITVRDPKSSTDCTITLNSVDPRYDGIYTCAPYMSRVGVVDALPPAHVILAKKPSRLAFVDVDQTGMVLASAGEPTSVTCQASDARPPAELTWYLGNTQIYDGIQVEDVSSGNRPVLTTSLSTLTKQFNKADNGASLRCVSNHAGYNDNDNKETALTIDVQYSPYRPEGNKIGKLYGFTAEQQGQITVNFTANPVPDKMSWKVADKINVPVGGQSLDKRFTASTLETISRDLGKYALSLTIDPVRLDDQSKTFQLNLGNRVGMSSFDFTIRIGPAPPPAALSGTTIAVIIIAVILLLLIIGLVAFGRSRGKWCFAASAAGDGLEPGEPADAETATTKDGIENADHDHKLAPETGDTNIIATPTDGEHKNGTNGSAPASDTPV